MPSVPAWLDRLLRHYFTAANPNDADVLTFDAGQVKWKAPSGGAGSQGPVGPAGAPGMQGEEGDPGPIGSPGPIGAAGADGSAGAAGALGPPGPAGEDGDPGPSGPPGAIGPAGDAGIPGPSGSSGPAVFLLGEQGEDGLWGPPGKDGAAGSPGSGGLNVGTATLDFGATPAESAVITVSGQAWVLSTSAIKAFFMKDSTVDNGTDEHEEASALCPLVIGNLVAGNSFDIIASPIAMLGLGQFKVRWEGSA